MGEGSDAADTYAIFVNFYSNHFNNDHSERGVKSISKRD